METRSRVFSGKRKVRNGLKLHPQFSENLKLGNGCELPQWSENTLDRVRSDFELSFINKHSGSISRPILTFSYSGNILNSSMFLFSDNNLRQVRSYFQISVCLKLRVRSHFLLSVSLKTLWVEFAAIPNFQIIEKHSGTSSHPFLRFQNFSTQCNVAPISKIKKDMYG